MIIRPVLPHEKDQFDALVTHPLQSWAWGDFRLALGNQVVRLGQFDNSQMISAFTLIIHKFPNYLPILNKYTLINASRTVPLSEDMIFAIHKTALENNSIYAKLEPDIFYQVSQDSTEQEKDNYPNNPNLIPAEPWFTPYSGIINLELNNQELLSSFHPKTRYNINLAKRHNVVVSIDNSDQSLESYLNLTSETTSRQAFYAHTKDYHRLMWQTMHKAKIANLMVARYQNQIISAWILFQWHDKLFYPYGASTREHRQVMANYLMVWESIQFGKSMNLKTFDLWGVLGPEVELDHPWMGFHKFKMSFNPQYVKYINTKDLVTNSYLYFILKAGNSIRKSGLKTKAILKKQIYKHLKKIKL